MKITADAVLFGAWIDTTGAHRILDIGAGSGLLTLMAAQQHPKAQLTGIELDNAAAQQAQKNAAASPFSKRITIEQGDIRDFESSTPFDLIISNPPFFESGSLSPDQRRRQARSEEELKLPELLHSVVRGLSSNGRFSLVWPARRFDELEQSCNSFGLFLVRKTMVHSRAVASAHVVFSTWQMQPYESVSDMLNLRDAQGATNEWKSLVEPFYPDINRLK